MARKVSVVLVDDLDESEATQTISFSLDGSSYEIDLNDVHAGQLRDAFAPWVGAARRAGRAPARRSASRRPRPPAAGSDRELTQKMREWGRSRGHQVSDRGRLSADLVAAYEAAH